MDTLKYPIVFFTGLSVTYLITPILRFYSAKLGILDNPGERRIHDTPIPRSGGIAVFCGFHAACAVLYLYPWAPFNSQLDATWWINLLVASTVLLLVGVIDDIWGLKPLVKLFGQLGSACLAYSSGMRFRNMLGIGLPEYLDFALTIFWILAIVNSFNLIDGMDGLATGLAIIGSVGLAGSLILRQLPGDALVLIGLMGACFAFLRFNFHPASIFLGDAGSMFLGFTLAIISLSTSSKGTIAAAIGIPILAVGVPVIDTLLAIWRRSVRGLRRAGGGNTGVMQADMDHLHHRLLKLGISQRKVAYSLYVVNGLLVFVGLMSIIFKSSALGIYLIAFVAAVYVLVKHLARVELWDSGAAIIAGLRRPSSRTNAVIIYPLADCLLLALILGFSIAVTHPMAEWPTIKTVWLHAAPVHIGIPFITLMLINTYGRVWSRARISEFAIFAVTLTGAILLSAAVTILMTGVPSRMYLTQTVVFTSVSVATLTGCRGFFQTVMDLMSTFDRHPSHDHYASARILVYGASDACGLFIKQKSLLDPDEGIRRKVVGIIDDDSNLRKRYVHGYKVLGGVGDLPAVIDTYYVDEIVVTTSLDDPIWSKLVSLAVFKGVTISEWKVEETVRFQADLQAKRKVNEYARNTTRSAIAEKQTVGRGITPATVTEHKPTAR